MVQETETLKILQKKEDMMEYAYPALAQYPRSERYAMVADMKRSMDKMLEKAIEAEKKYYKKTTLQELDIEIMKMKTYVKMSYKLRFLPDKKRNVMNDYLAEIGRMLGGWIKTCQAREGNKK